ncbi:MAG TPA: site-specific integrase [Streptosporangiaceae bacterium]|nr:site-specific integrase [Streptosporangiaceae bacterium]
MPGRRQQGEGSVYHRKDRGQWVAVADLGRKGGKRDRREFTAPTPGEALEKRDKFLDRRRDGFTMPKGRQPYVSEWMLHWLHNVAKRKVAATTWEKSYRQKVTDLICPFFESVVLPELAEDDIEAWHAHLEETISERTGQPLSASTIGQAHRIMSTAIKAAVVRGRLPRNPVSNVTPPQVTEREFDLPSQADVKCILKECETWPRGDRWVLAVTTGLRQGERLALEWKRDIHLRPPASVSVRKSAARVKGERIVKAPKSAASLRSVPLAAVAVRALARGRKDQVASISDLVYTDAKGQPVHPRADWQDWQDLLAKLGLPRYRVHDCRHVYATMLLEAGVDPRVVQAMLGHSTGVLLKRYQHVRPVLHQQVADVIDGLFGGG